MQPKIDLPDSTRETIEKALNALLSMEVGLYLKTRSYHWNVQGSSFYSLHKFLEDQYGSLESAMDDTAERVRALGGLAKFTVESLAANRLTLPAPEMLSDLLFDHEKVIRTLRVQIEYAEKAGDCGTVNYLSGLIEQHEKMAWMLRAFEK